MLQLLTGNRACWTLAWVTWLATAVACGPGSPPELPGLTDQVAQVGTELMLGLNGTDPDGDHLTYGFHADDLRDVDGAATITSSPGGTGVFRWTPLESDVGRHSFDFTASDAAHTTSVTIAIDVRSAIGAATAPVFRSPDGDGTTLDLTLQPCVDVDVAVDDSDSATVQIAQADPPIPGAELHVQDGHTATWHWCPTREQQAEPRYLLMLTADDGDNPKATKTYLVVLRGNGGASCPGAPPAISHTAADATSIVDLAIQATISDDKGIKDAPLFYYATAQPATPLDLSKMTQLTMQETSGNRTSGTYSVSVPNPVAQQPSGTQQTLYYVFVASDDDDATGTCDHSTTSQVYSMKVTSSGTADLPICAACTSDAQCGRGDECVRIGASGASYCLQACGAGCPSGYTCSTSSVTSVDGASAPQCVPQSGTCTMSATACVDDTWEVNDTMSDASHNPVLAPDLYDLVSCPNPANTARANDDWFKIVVPSDQRIDLQLAGGTASDLDLHLYHSDGTVIAASTGLDANEEISVCLPAATYYVKVNGFGNARNEYLLSYDSRAESCAAAACVDDSHENDDSAAQARPAGAGYTSTGNMICPDDDDWYHVVLFTGDLLTVDLSFIQSTPAQDLDIHVYSGGVDLTPCDASAPDACSVDNGQGGMSNEHAAFVVTSNCDAGCDFDVVVRGYNHSSNSYGIAIDIQ